MNYVEKSARKDNEYFPMFLMGKSLQSYARVKAANPFSLRDMKVDNDNLKNTNMQI